jgi:hypothetical protein
MWEIVSEERKRRRRDVDKSEIRFARSFLSRGSFCGVN